MKKKLKVAIVGRPNVGKSALFNRIVGQRLAIVDEMEGVTRDRLYAPAEHFGRQFIAIDTGGIDTASTAVFNDSIRRQAEIAILEADSIVLVVDGQIGVTEQDLMLARVLLKTAKPIVLAVNKIDHPRDQPLLGKFYTMGIKEVVATSAAHGYQIAELLEKALSPLPDEAVEEEEETIKVAIVGRPNVGKSTLVNSLLQEERCIVSPIPGTTRDSIDIAFTFDGKKYTLIDTAGIRRKKSEKEVVDKFAHLRTERSIERADICLLILDVQEGITAQEKKILNSIEEAGKPCILILNKWDLTKGFRMEHALQALEEEASFARHCPRIAISALESRNLEKIFPLVDEVITTGAERVSTHQLNVFVEKALQRNHPPMIQGKRLRIYYMTQIGTSPPQFVVFVNRPDLMIDSYKKYLLNSFREVYPFPGYPLELHLRGKKQRDMTHQHVEERFDRRHRESPKELSDLTMESPEPYEEDL
jgi:GTP-binding protein